MVNNFREAILEDLFPNHCLLCQLRSHGPYPLCSDCRDELAPNTCACQRCALPLADTGQTARLCGQCLQTPPPFQQVLAPWLYCEYLAYLIQRWKFQREQRLTALLAELWLEQVPTTNSIDLLVPIPLHWRRQWQRGYNQAELLARRLLSHHPGISPARLETGLLRRGRATRAQSGMDAKARLRNLHGAFTVHKPCDNLRIAVVDDVLTTGATAAAAASALNTAGAAHVEIWCVARTPAPDR